MAISYRVLIPTITAVTLLCLASCSGNQEARIAVLENRIAELEAQNKKAADEVRRLTNRVQFSETSRDLDGVAFLTPGDRGYSPLKFDLGYLTVSLEDIQPYANGSKVKLKIGNLTSARINGLKAKLEWGAVDTSGVPKDEGKSREVSFEEALRSGSWTAVDVVLEAVPPADFGYLRVREVSNRGIGLLGR